MQVIFHGSAHLMIDGIEGVRSVKGALHFLPSLSREITEDEFRWLEKNRPEVFARLEVLPGPAVKQAPVVKAPEPVAEAPVEESAEVEEAEDTATVESKGRSRRRRSEGD